MNLALKDGSIALTVALGTGKLDTAIDPDNVRFDDNVWHHILVQRHSSAVSIISLPRFCFTIRFQLTK
jgi:leucine-rich repeat transmembrane neuronal protein 1/2